MPGPWERYQTNPQPSGDASAAPAPAAGPWQKYGANPPPPVQKPDASISMQHLASGGVDLNPEYSAVSDSAIQNPASTLAATAGPLAAMTSPMWGPATANSGLGFVADTAKALLHPKNWGGYILAEEIMRHLRDGGK